MLWRKFKICSNVQSKNVQSRNVQSKIKPNAKSFNIHTDVNGTAKDLNNSDSVFVIIGTNVIDQHTDIDKLLHEIEDSLKKFTRTNIIFSYIPYRYDVPKLNHTIRLINFKLKSLNDKYRNITLLSLNF